MSLNRQRRTAWAKCGICLLLLQVCGILAAPAALPPALTPGGSACGDPPGACAGRHKLRSLQAPAALPPALTPGGSACGDPPGACAGRHKLRSLQAPAALPPALAPGGIDSEAAAVGEQALRHRISYRIHEIHPHPSSHFTQGLLYANGFLYESSGLYGKSSIILQHFPGGREAQRKALPADLFAEGLALHDGSLFLLTWRAGKAFRLDADNLEILAQYQYEGEGWGLTSDGQSLIMSNGSAKLRYRNPETFQIERELPVTHDDVPVNFLNELEWIEGHIWANIWQQDKIVSIDPKTGKVVKEIDFSLLRLRLGSSSSEVLNGIAWLPEERRMLVTGKLWPALFEIEIPED